MNVGGRAYRTIWRGRDGRTVEIIDQTRLPHEFATVALRTVDDAVHAIRSMQVRGAPLIGVTAAYGVCLALCVDESDEGLNGSVRRPVGLPPHGHQSPLDVGDDAGGAEWGGARRSCGRGV